MEYKRKRNFFFGVGINFIGRIYMKKAYNNMFFTLTDLNNRVICCKTSKAILGRCSKKRRIAPHSIELVINAMKHYFTFYNLLGVQIYFKNKFSSHFRYLINALLLCNLQICRLRARRPLAFTKGVRGRRLRKK